MGWPFLFSKKIMAYALITGASKGIGKSIAAELAAKGHNIILVARSQMVLKELSESFEAQYKINCKYLAIDLTKENAAKAVFNYCTNNNYVINILVNNAGYGLNGSFEKYSTGEYADLMKINMLVPVELCQLFLPCLKLLDSAYILNIASTTSYQSVPGFTIYAASKAFVLSFTRSLRQELKKTTVSVTCVSPGSTDTDFVNRAQAGDKAKKLAEKVNMTPDAVAKIAVKSMFNKKAEVIPGFINKLSVFLVWLLPKSVAEVSALKIYKP